MSGMSGDKTKKWPWWHWALAIVGTAAFIVLLFWGPWWIEGYHLYDDKGDLYSSAGIIVTGLRTSLVAIAAGGFTAAGLWYTHKKHQLESKKHELEADSQVTERYVESVKLLGSGNQHECLGGIYSLERIMKDSDRDHPTIVEVLSAFVRTNLAKTSVENEPWPPGLPEDIKAALAVLNRRPYGQRIDFQVDLTGARLHRYDLSGARWEFVQLGGAFLRDTLLKSASLERAHLAGADLMGVNLTGAHLEAANFEGASLLKVKAAGASLANAILAGANLFAADLEGADLEGADLTGARLGSANLDGVKLAGTHLEAVELHQAVGLKVEQLCEAVIYESTKVPAAMATHAAIGARVKQCEAARAAGEAPPTWAGNVDPE